MDDLGASVGEGSLACSRVVDVDAVRVDDTTPLAYDQLTGLVSREVFDAQLTRALERTWRAPTVVAVLLLRIHDLTLVNDRFGRPVGDEVLAAAADRLRSCLREVDLVARIDTSTFGVVLEADHRETRPEAMAGDVANRLVALFAEPLSTSLTDLAVQASIGVAVADSAALTAHHLVDRAELAVVEAARTEPGFRFYEASQQVEAVRRLQLKAALGRAIERETLLRYQPLVSLKTGATLGVEALLRWSDPDHGDVSPADFIPVAEETELIIPIGEWVLRTALEQRAAWAREVPGLPVIGLSVNVSARQMARPGLVDAVRTGLEATGLAPEVLLLELTESVLMADDDVVRAQLKGLRQLGVRLGLDDFGTGWSSLEYLNRLPVDVLKIAQVFVDQIGTSTRATALVRAIIDLAHSLGLITVAEGVETEEQADRLRQMGCFLGQGWHFSRELAVPDATLALSNLAEPPPGGRLELTVPSVARAGAALLVTLLVGALVVQGPVALASEATTPEVSVTLPMLDTDWTRTATLPRFDPALGELREVHLSIAAEMEGSISLENLDEDDDADDVVARAAATVTVGRPGGGTALASAAPGETRNQDLGEYDGDLDYEGPSGDVDEIDDDLTTHATLTDAADLALFTGAGTIALPTTGTDTSVPPSDPDVDALITTRVGAEVSVSYTYVFDDRPPDPPTIVSYPSTYTADAAPAITFTHEGDETTECQLTTPTTTVGWAPCSSPWIGDLDPTGDGAYTFAVRATDLAGNVGVPATRSFTLDRVAPAEPTVSFVLLGPLPLLGRWTFTIEPDATARCSLDGAAPSSCTSPFTIDLATLLDGDHTFAVFAVDAAGNAGPVASSTHTFDRLAPDPPTITSHPASPGNDPTPTWTFDLAVEATGATCAIDGAAPVACSSPFTANLGLTPDGPHTLAVRNADASGNESDPALSTYTLDRALPGAPTILGPRSPGNDPTPTWSIDAEVGATTECRLDGGAWSACDGSYTASFGPGSDGLHVLAARATDAAGNVGPMASSGYHLDATAPPAPTFVAGPADLSNVARPVWTFTIEGGSRATCSFDDGPWTVCSSPHRVDLGTAPDGPHSLAVRATDDVGNVGPASTSRFVLDRAAPTAPNITGSPESPGNAATVTFTFGTPAGSTATCRIDGGIPFDCADSVTTTFAVDGDHRFAVAAVDAAGNPSSPAEAVYSLDRVAPRSPVITSSPASPSSATTPRWEFALATGSAGECRVDQGPWAPCAFSYIADLATAADGTHTFSVRSTDAAGNVGPADDDAFRLDRTPPAAPEITDGPSAHSDDDRPRWVFTAEHGADVECRLDDGAWKPCRTSVTFDLRGAPDGIHALELRATDGVGNVGPVTLITYELDRADPVPAAFTATPISPGNDATPEWSFHHEPGTMASCSLDGAEPVPCRGLFTAEPLSDGLHHLTITVVDLAGNVSGSSTITYDLDTVAPVAPLVTAPRSPDRDVWPEWLLEVEPGTVAECSLDGAAPVACASVFGADLTGLDGPHVLVVIARDAAGNASEPTSSTFILDTVAPPAPVILHTPDEAAWVWRFSIEAGATSECSIDAAPWTSCSSGLAGGTPDRTVRFEVRATDRAGNRSAVTGVTTTPTRGTVVPPPPPDTPPPPPTPHATPEQVAEPEVAPAPAPEPEIDPVVPTRPVDRVLAPDPEPSDSVAAPTRRPMTDNGFLAGPVRELLESAAQSSTVPMLVVLVVLAFVAVQNRIDRRDPKLADAPIRHEPEYLEFE